jgi:pilus assembly protein CpaE
MNMNSGILNAAALMVCVDPATAEKMVHGVEQMPWMVTAAGFETYISASRRPYFAPAIKTASTVIAVVDFDGDSDQAVETTKYLHQTFPGKLTVIALAQPGDQALLLKAMRAGCSEFLYKPFNEIVFMDSLARIQEHLVSPGLRVAPSGSVLSFFGAKGGVGSTTLAVHLAMYLVEYHKKKVLLIDNKPELGHVCVYLGLDGSRYHFNEVVRNVNRLDSELLRGFIAKHPSGLDVLSSPDICIGVKPNDPEAVSRTLEFLRAEYDFVIVDCATSLNESNLAVIEASTRMYLVATQEISAIRDLSRYVDNLMQVEYATEKMHVVINRFSSRYEVNVEQIEKAIRLPVEIRLPNSYTELVRSVNLGEPLSAKNKTDFTIQLTKWANLVVGSSSGAPPPPPPVKKSGSLFGLFK